MELCPLPADEAAVSRYVEELWLPYHRELEATVDRHALAEDVDLVGPEVEFRLERLETTEQETWIAVDDTSDGPTADVADLAVAGGDLAGFVTTEVDESPVVFDQPDGLLICDFYVREPYRGTGLARDLIDRAAARAREKGCDELALEVDVDNERAIAFYEKLGFEPLRSRMSVDVGRI